MTELKKDARLLQQITVRNLLSFGPESPTLPLESLNVLIGPNGSGKSNLLEVVSLLRSTIGDPRNVLWPGGGAAEWIWKGAPNAVASVDAVVTNLGGSQPLRHYFSFRVTDANFSVETERIENEAPYEGKSEPYFFYRFEHGRAVANTRLEGRGLAVEAIDADRSVLAQRRDPVSYPEISYLADVYQRIRGYRDWQFGRNTTFRSPQRADMPNDSLAEDFSNLGLFLNRLRQNPKAKRSIISALKDLYSGLDDFDVRVQAGTVQIFLTEGDFVIPAPRLSDGTLRYLALTAILCDPTPPPLICVEEPELGLHPDLLPKLADLLILASERTQLIVTTHSDILVDAMTERPESVVIVEKCEGQTSMRRLDAKELAGWLGKYRLGNLWIRGQIGGTRW